MMFFALPIAWRLGIVAAAFLAVVGSATAVYFKIRHTAVVEERMKIEKEKVDAINKANAAKDILRRLCAERPDECVRDEWLRD